LTPRLGTNNNNNNTNNSQKHPTKVDKNMNQDIEQINSDSKGIDPDIKNSAKIESTIDMASTQLGSKNTLLEPSITSDNLPNYSTVNLTKFDPSQSQSHN